MAVFGTVLAYIVRVAAPIVQRHKIAGAVRPLFNRLDTPDGLATAGSWSLRWLRSSQIPITASACAARRHGSPAALSYRRPSPSAALWTALARGS
jgi:hypothetical protein